MSYTWKNLRDWVLDRNPEVTDLDADTDIIETRIVNSLQFVELMLYVEELCGRELGADEVNLEAFRTLRSIEKSFLSPDSALSSAPSGSDSTSALSSGSRP